MLIPRISLVSMLAPLEIKMVIQLECPCPTAQCRGVAPIIFTFIKTNMNIFHFMMIISIERLLVLIYTIVILCFNICLVVYKECQYIIVSFSYLPKILTLLGSILKNTGRCRCRLIGRCGLLPPPPPFFAKRHYTITFSA